MEITKDDKTTVDALKQSVKRFSEERGWIANHTPKNLSMYLSIKAAELMEFFLWSESKESEEVLEQRREEIENKIADTMYVLLIFCVLNKIDLSDAMKRKLAISAKKYPIEKCKGKNLKYDQL